jgi:hypothetical protein
MGRVIVIEFVSPDGGMPDPDGREGTAQGGWAFRYGLGPTRGPGRPAHLHLPGWLAALTGPKRTIMPNRVFPELPSVICGKRCA